jgi:hypothetical protein
MNYKVSISMALPRAKYSLSSSQQGDEGLSGRTLNISGVGNHKSKPRKDEC